MLTYERQLWADGIKYVAGIDEVGRGCLLGDVVAAAVIMPVNVVIDRLDDSKKLTPKKRDALYDEIMEKAVAVSIASEDVKTIERINIKQAARLAMKRAVEQLSIEAQYLLIDAEKVDLPIAQLSLIRGDALSQSIAAASVIAKVTRDRMCLYWDTQYPEYGIALHKGYATKSHREKIIEFGATPLHRPSFLRNILAAQQELF